MWKSFDKWLMPSLLRKRPELRPGPVHVMLCVCDHFEPLHHSDEQGAKVRLNEWRQRFPAITREFRDADGLPPKHTFFYPVEQYRPALIEDLAGLCAETGSEVEIHLHHHADTAENFRHSLEQGIRDLRNHGLLGSDATGAARYGFIHGNWALNNSHPDGAGCGVDREIPILRETGCYADFTMPSAPHPTQTTTVNAIYYAQDKPGRKSHNRGEAVTTGKTSAYRAAGDRLLMVQGPLGLDWRRRKWGILPRVENGDLTGANPPTLTRLRFWLDVRVGVVGQPNWIFVKLHTHGGIPRNYETLLGEAMHDFHRDAARTLSASEYLQLHYVSAREMVNLIHAAEDGVSGEPGNFRDYLVRPPAAVDSIASRKTRA